MAIDKYEKGKAQKRKMGRWGKKDAILDGAVRAECL